MHDEHNLDGCEISAVPDVYQIAYDAVKTAAEAYRRTKPENDPGNRQMLKFAAILALNCRLEEAEKRNVPAIVDALSIAQQILEITEPVILDERKPKEKAELASLLAECLWERRFWLPVLYGPNCKTAGEELVELLRVGKESAVDYTRKWSLETPMNRFCLRIMSMTNEVLDSALAGDASTLRTEYPVLSIITAKDLVGIAQKRKTLEQLSKDNAAEWAKQIFIPFIMAIDPTLETISEAKQILSTKRIRQNGEKPGNLRSELQKRLPKALKTMLRTNSVVPTEVA